jgi:hypothetical protein
MRHAQKIKLATAVDLDAVDIAVVPIGNYYD